MEKTGLKRNVECPGLLIGVIFLVTGSNAPRANCASATGWPHYWRSRAVRNMGAHRTCREVRTSPRSDSMHGKPALLHYPPRVLLAVAAGALIAGCSAGTFQTPPLFSSPEPAYQPLAGPRVILASWYGPGFSGRRTADGEVYNQEAFTAASKSLPLGSRVRVTNPHNGRSVVVRINDRGPFVRGRELDLSKGAAERIGLIHGGVGRVAVTPVSQTRSRLHAYRRIARRRPRRRRPELTFAQTI